MLSLVFKNFFRYEIGDDVYSLSDTKSVLGRDMGLVILNRMIDEGKDISGNLVYEACYVCRMAASSGSGQLIKFREDELISPDGFEIRETERRTLLEERNILRRAQDEEALLKLGLKLKDKVETKTQGIFIVVGALGWAAKLSHIEGFGGHSNHTKLIGSLEELEAFKES